MRKLLTFLSLSATVLVASAQNDILNEQFNDERLPNGFYTKSYDGMGFKPRSIGSEKLLHYGGMTPEKTWFVNTIDDGNGVTTTAALSASHRDTPGKATDNWLITPAVEIKEGMLLRWDARSVHKGFPEKYDVRITEGDNVTPEQFKVIYTCDEETYPWSTHIIDMKDYVGKKIRIAFVHNATDTYLLAIDNIRVGALTDRKLTATNFSQHFTTIAANADNVFPIDLRLHNNGRELKIKKIYIEMDGEEVSASPLVDFTIPRASYLDVVVPLTIEDGKEYSYTVKALLDNDAEITLAEDAIWVNKNRRTLVTEKFTGAWCTSCPRLTPLCQRLEEHFGDELIIVEPHFFYPGVKDDLANSTYGGTYGGPLTFSDYPTMLFNRNRSKKMNVLKPRILTPMTDALSEDVIAKVSLQAVDIKQPGIARLVTYVTPSENIDNSNDNYRVAYAVIRERSVSENVQQNGAVMLGNDFSEYHILPGQVPGDAIIHFNVPIGENMPEGVVKSLPAELEAGKTYTSTYVIEFPDNIPARELKFITYLVRTDGDFEILNAASHHALASEQKNIVIHSASRVQTGALLPLEVTCGKETDAIEWVSSNNSVATVENGVVEGISAGKVTITAKTPEGNTDHEITVFDNAPISLVRTPQEQSVEEVAVSDSEILLSFNGGILNAYFPFDADYSIEVFGIDGIKKAIMHDSGTMGQIDLKSMVGSGLSIVRLTQGEDSVVCKIIIR